ncbi:hypothetical protein ACFSHT_07005 [Paraburkholderia silviterrae]|uniref:Uncharacterized protein n=1 Tax=Paraburkholderia silviterrae TaxID=2528715 RepID=A0A4V2ZZB5_9BURK|nr:hypothetical protein [Paraburkholderia silviterrae]TDG24641.1 hypothetical protein EYW47_08805 [Paraburkholderia silviterrae]
MQVEFAFAASSAAAVATHPVWFFRSAETGISATSITGMHVAHAGGTNAVFVTDQKVLADAAVNGSAAGTQGPSAGWSKAVYGHAASFDAAGRTCAKGCPKVGVMTYDARKAGREARRASVVAKVTGS